MAAAAAFIDRELNGVGLDEDEEEDEDDVEHEDVDTDESVAAAKASKANLSKNMLKTCNNMLSLDQSSDTLIAIRDMAIRDKQQRKHKTSTSSASSMTRSSTIKKC